MLGKLLKHEFKATARIIPIIFLTIIGLLITGTIFKTLRIDFFIGTNAMLLVLGGIICIGAVFIFSIMRYFKSMFGAEGYLTQTLPVSKGNLLASKMIVSLFWIICGYIFTILSIFGAVFVLGYEDQFKAILDSIPPRFFVLIGVFILIQSILYISSIYFCITLANTHAFIKNNILMSIVWVFVTYTVLQIIELMGMMFIPISVNLSGEGSIFVFKNMLSAFTSMGNTETLSALGIGSAITDTICSIVFVLVTRWLLMRKTSVK